MLAASMPLAAAAAQSDTVTISQGVDADTLDPIKSTVTTTYNVVQQMYDALVFYDDDGTPKPDLALSWRRVSPTVVEYKLRKGVKFWNGDPFTSADVKFSIEKIKDPAYKSSQTQYVAEITDVRTPDPYTVQLVTAKPTFLFPLIRQRVFIVDSKYWKEHNDAYMAEHPMGTGPYTLKAWKKDDQLELDANPNYFLGAPKIAHVIFKPIPDAASRVAALKTGETDWIANVPFQYATSIEGGRTTKMVSARSSRQLFIAFNTLQPGPQQNKLVRQAFNYAVDVPSILKNVLGGRGNESLVYPPTYHFYDKSIKGYTHDLAKAKALLAQAGYPEGKGIELTLNTPSGRYNRDKEVAEAIAAQLGALGAKITVRTWEWTNYVGLTARRGLTPMYELGWSGGHVYDPDAVVTGVLSGSSALSTWANPEFDKLVDAARYELDPKKRQAEYSKAVAIAKEEAPWIFLFQYEDLYASARRLIWQPRGDEEIRVFDMRLQS